MKQIFDWLREQMHSNSYDCCESNYSVDMVVDEDVAIRIVNEAEAKWEEDCCEWKFFKPSNSLYENHGDFRTGDELEKWSVCPYCGKRIFVKED